MSNQQYNQQYDQQPANGQKHYGNWQPVNQQGDEQPEYFDPTFAALMAKEVTFTPLGESDPIKLTCGTIRNYLCKPTKQGHWPDDAEVLKYLMVCKQRQLNPFAGDCYLLGYDSSDGPQFSLIVSIQALLKRAEINEQFDGIESGVIVVSDSELIERQGDFVEAHETIAGGWAKVYRKDRSRPFYQRLNISTYNKFNSQWKKDGPGMICKCFDVETEVLTSKGFRKFADVDSPVMQVTESGLEPVAAQPFCQDYAGQMVEFDSDDLNFCVTPNHDMVTTGGKIEAGDMYEAARSRPTFWIPRIIHGTKPDAAISDESIMLAAAYLCCGYDAGKSRFEISVSRQYKIEALNAIGLFRTHRIQSAAGHSAVSSSGRVITTKSDKMVFGYGHSSLGGLIGRDRSVNWEMLASLSRRQARILADTMCEFDGSQNSKTGVRRFHQSRLDVTDAFELASVVAGYSVGSRHVVDSDISTKPGYSVTISERDEISVRRWGRFYKFNRPATSHGWPSLSLSPNHSGKVWCVTVPSGVIVVRRRGFSMLCGNCAEAGALRQAFPSDVGGLYLAEEIHSEARQAAASEAAEKPKPAVPEQVKLSDLMGGPKQTTSQQPAATKPDPEPFAEATGQQATGQQAAGQRETETVTIPAPPAAQQQAPQQQAPQQAAQPAAKSRSQQRRHAAQQPTQQAGQQAAKPAEHQRRPDQALSPPDASDQTWKDGWTVAINQAGSQTALDRIFQGSMSLSPAAREWVGDQIAARRFAINGSKPPQQAAAAANPETSHDQPPNAASPIPAPQATQGQFLPAEPPADEDRF